ncbi:MAG: tetratricopeptide repeat protein [Betaproteobacteria bacterium]|nr:tetratricopeptide repeat protein [Betaproteobacteria bacterium]
MSLLMDALKRAEASKASRQQADKEANRLSLEPLAREAAESSPLPDLAAHLAAVDAELARSAQAPRPKASSYAPPAANGPRTRNSFTVKEGAPAARRGLFWLTLGALTLAGLGIGGYVWYRVSDLGVGQGQLAASRPQPPATPLPYYPPPAEYAPPPAEAPPIAVTRQAAPPAVDDAPPFAPVPRAAPQPRPEPLPATPPISLTRTPPRADPNLVQAHLSLQAGDLQGARQDFLQTLQRNPHQIEALLALAAIAQHQGRQSEADAWRQRALTADPGNPAAQAAALASRAAGGDALLAESQLKTLLASQPQSAELNFALGNVYARQQRWAEAQPCYFNAVAADADNPDYLFNLAVSLDQLRQPRLAAQHYQLALEAATQRPASFDSEQARRRLADLSP